MTRYIIHVGILNLGLLQKQAGVGVQCNCLRPRKAQSSSIEGRHTIVQESPKARVAPAACRRLSDNDQITLSSRRMDATQSKNN